MPNLNDQRGLTLLEVLLATVLLGLVASAVFNLFTVGARLDGDVRKHMEAVRVAEAELERLKAAPYDAVESGGEPEEIVGWYGGYRVWVAVVEHDGGKTVTVTAECAEGEPARTVSFVMERAAP